MKRTTLILLAMLTALAVTGSDTHAQIPDEFTNLKVLPKDISKQALIGMMRGFAGALGVRCNHCHVGPENLQGMDFAVDDKNAKKVAREMMQLVDAINGKYLAGIDTGRDERVEVQCLTCHGGLSVPRSIQDVVARRIDGDGLEAGLKLYREAREEHYGDAAYDFSSGPLNELAEHLGQSGKLDEALAIAQMNVEFHPADSYSRMMLGGIHAARGEKPKAIAAFKKAVEIEPNNTWARRQLAALESETE